MAASRRRSQTRNSDFTGHPEKSNAAIKELRGFELLSGPAQTLLPVMMAVDFNSGPNDPFCLTGTYNNITEAGFAMGGIKP
jgi:hypothetical protein